MPEQPGDELDSSPLLPAYGPFHRQGSPSQTASDTLLQLQSNEIWGLPARGSDIPKVKAFRGFLDGAFPGVEFYCQAPPDIGSSPGLAFWSAGRPGVRMEDGYAKIGVVITRWRSE